MEFNLPDNYSSAYTGAIFSVASASTTNPHTVEVIDNDAATTLGVRRVWPFNNTTLNLSRYIRMSLNPQPILTGEGFVLPDGRDVGISLSVDDTLTEERRFTSSLTNLTANTLLSTLTNRAIAEGECDEIALFAEAGRVELSVTPVGESSAQTIGAYDHSGGLLVYSLQADTLLSISGADNAARDCQVMITIDGAPLATIRYTIRQATEHNVRLAWLNPYGAIDYHTFHSLGSLLRTEKERLVGPEGVRVVASQGVWEEVLSSGYLSVATAKALATLLTSPRVWRIRGESIEAVDVTDESMTISDGDTLSAIRVVVRDANPQQFQTF